MPLKSFPLLLIAAFLGMVVFGFLGLSCYGKADCQMTVIPGMHNNVCASLEDSMALAVYHISCLENVSQSVLGSGPTFVAVSTLLLMAFFFVCANLFRRDSVGLYSGFNIKRAPEALTCKTKRKILRWLSFLEKRDPALVPLRAHSLSLV